MNVSLYVCSRLIMSRLTYIFTTSLFLFFLLVSTHPNHSPVYRICIVRPRVPRREYRLPGSKVEKLLPPSGINVFETLDSRLHSIGNFFTNYHLISRVTEWEEGKDI